MSESKQSLNPGQLRSFCMRVRPGQEQVKIG
jgi:hypothetical protein